MTSVHGSSDLCNVGFPSRGRYLSKTRLPPVALRSFLRWKARSGPCPRRRRPAAGRRPDPCRARCAALIAGDLRRPKVGRRSPSWPPAVPPDMVNSSDPLHGAIQFRLHRIGRMYTVDLYLRVRLACHVDGLSQREAASRFGIARETVRKMLRHSEPPGYRRRQPPKRPKLAPFTDIIDRILEEDRPVHRKQHHTAKRIFERLRDEHGFTGKETIVKDYVRERRLRRREMFVPLSHPPGHAQADFGEADAIIAGVKYRAHFFVMTLPHSDACFVAAYPAATTEAWLDGHNRAFVFFGGVPQSILYDNDKCLVSRILSDGTAATNVGVQRAAVRITSSRTAYGRLRQG